MHTHMVTWDVIACHVKLLWTFFGTNPMITSDVITCSVCVRVLVRVRGSIVKNKFTLGLSAVHLGTRCVRTPPECGGRAADPWAGW